MHREAMTPLCSIWTRWRRERLKTAGLPGFSAFRVLPEDDLEREYPAYPLYRMTGCIVDYHRLLDLGVPGLEAEVRRAMKENPEKEDFYQGLLGVLELLSDCCRYYASQCREMAATADGLSAFPGMYSWILSAEPPMVKHKTVPGKVRFSGTVQFYSNIFKTPL